MPKTEIILDESAENPIQEGFDVVRTEVEFLQKDGGDKLWVSGRPCRYARSVYKARNVPVMDLESPRLKLNRLAGTVADDVSPSVLSSCIQVIERDKPQTLGDLLAGLTNDDFWNSSPSSRHAARYLLIDVKDDLLGLCEAQRRMWAKLNSSQQFLSIYSCEIKEREKGLREWLLDKEVRGNLGEFPVKLDEENAKLLHRELGKQLRSSQGTAIDDFPKQSPNKKVYGHTIVEYFTNHPDRVSSDAIATVSSLLSAGELSTLQGLLSQSEIARIDVDSGVRQVLSWATDDYLPFRESPTSADRTDNADLLARSFADWLLKNYPKLVFTDRDESQINIRTFYTVKRLSKQHWVLWVVVDGLSFINHQKLIRLISEQSCQLRAAENIPLIAVLPTITEKAKYGLTTGKFPGENENGEWTTKNNFLAEFPKGIYAGNNSGAKLLTGLKSETPSVGYWNYTIIDNCYHQNTDVDFLNTTVEGHLDTLAKHIDKMVSQAFDPDRVAVVICSDHGQLTRRCSKLVVDTGNNHAHGRTLLYANGQPFPDADSSFIRSQDEKTVVLNPKSFRLSEPTAVALGSTYFVDLMANDIVEAIGVHGGLYPEEVVVGLAVLTRQPVCHEVKATISGTGETDRPGNVHLFIDNPNPLIMNPLSVHIDGLELGGQGELLLAKVAPHDTLDIDIPIDQFPQPTNEGEFLVNGILTFEFDGVAMETPVSGTLVCKSLYKPKNPGLLGRF